jgi:hypothetical protein
MTYHSFPGLASEDSDWTVQVFDGYNPSLLDEPAPFELRPPHPDTSLELSDMSFLQENEPMLTETREPRCCDVLEHIPEWFVPGVTADDVEIHRNQRKALIQEGIRPSATEEDIWGRIQRFETPYLCSAEEEFFAMPEKFSFEQQFEAEFGDEPMLTSYCFSDTVKPVLETESADNTFIANDNPTPNDIDNLVAGDIDTILAKSKDMDTSLWTYEQLRTAVEKIRNPVLRRNMGLDVVEEADDSCF